MIRTTAKNIGAGISQAELPKIFDRFYQADPSRTPGTVGHGLGLAITKACADAVGGKIEVESKEGEYTLFTVTLPG